MLHFKGTRTMMFQLSGFYFKTPRNVYTSSLRALRVMGFWVFGLCGFLGLRV